MYRWALVVLAYVMATNLVRTRAAIAALIGSFLAAASAEALLGVAQTALGAGPASFVIANLATRSYGTIGMPNSYAGYLDLTLPLALALAVWAAARAWQAFQASGPIPTAPFHASRFTHHASPITNHESRITHYALRITLLALGLFALTALIGVGVITSFSRGAWLGLAAGGVAMIVALGRRGLPWLVGLAVLAGAAFALNSAQVLPAALADRLGSIGDQLQVFDVRGVIPTAADFAQVERLAHWQTAGNMFLSDPALGIGIGNFNDRWGDFHPPLWLYSQGHAHNYYLQAAAETGLAGLGAYALLLLTALWGAVRALRLTDGWRKAAAVGALGVLVTFIVHNVFEDLHVLNLGLHWAAVLALFVVLPQARDRGSGTTISTRTE